MSDFDVWLRDTFVPGDPHATIPGRRVCVRPVVHPTTMTAEQARQLAAHVLTLAGDAGPVLFADGRQPTENERHLLNLLSWREHEKEGLREEVARLQALVESIAVRVAGQSELLARRAARPGAKTFTCPDCGKQHDLGPVNAFGAYRCLCCGWFGNLKEAPGE